MRDAGAQSAFKGLDVQAISIGIDAVGSGNWIFDAAPSGSLR